jgi:hypothetical protein
VAGRGDAVAEMGPLWLGYNLHCLPNGWDDTKVLRVEIEKCWQRALKTWKLFA